MEQMQLERTELRSVDRDLLAEVGRRDRSPILAAILADSVAVAFALALVRVSPAHTILFFSAFLVAQVATRTYRHRLVLSILDDAPRIAVAGVAALVSLAAYPDFGQLPDRAPKVAAVAVALILMCRAGSYAILRAARRQGAFRESVLIVGAGAVGIELHELSHAHPDYGIRSAGLVDDVPVEGHLPLLGRIADLPRLIDEHEARMVIVAFGPTGEQELVSVLRAVRQRDVELAIVPRFFELGLAPSGPDVESLWGIPLYRVRRSALSTWTWPIKRATDVVVSGLGLTVAAPVMALLALAVRLSSPGPILFRQHRIGQFGREIEVLKFRTMRVNDDSDVTWTVANDPRLTKVGRWLRRTSLDELPQLFNVLRGDMSLVGPRPERPHFVEEYSASVSGYRDRHRLPVGLTGLAQVHGLRGDTSIAERARFDNAYVEHWTPWLDLKIAVQTVSAVIRDARSGAETSSVGGPDLRIAEDAAEPVQAPASLSVLDLRLDLGAEAGTA